MEIVAIYTDELSRLIVCFGCTTLALILGMLAAHFLKFEQWLEGIGTLTLAVSLLVPWFVPAITYYDAIVTDWNEVHEKGYKVVGVKGKIVTMIKEVE